MKTARATRKTVSLGENENSSSKDPKNKLPQLKIFREDEQRVTSLTLSRLFVGKVTTRESKAAMLAVLSAVQTRVTNSVVLGNHFFGPRRVKQSK